MIRRRRNSNRGLVELRVLEEIVKKFGWNVGNREAESS